MKNLSSHALTVILTLAVAGAGSYVYHQHFDTAPDQSVALNAPAKPVLPAADSASQDPALVVTQNSPGVDPANAASPEPITHLNPYAPVYSPPPGAATPSAWYTAYAAPAAAPVQPQVIAGLETPLGGVISIPPVTPTPQPLPALAYDAVPVVYSAPAAAPYDASGAYGGGVVVSSRRTTRQPTTPYLDSDVFTGAPFSIAKVPTNAMVVTPLPGTTVGASGTTTGTTSSTTGTNSSRPGSVNRRH